MKEGIIEEGRGGCLDALVTALSFGNFGILTQKYLNEFNTKIEFNKSKPPNQNDLNKLNGECRNYKIKDVEHLGNNKYVVKGIKRKIVRTPKIV